MPKLSIKIHYTTSDGTQFGTEEEALVHEQNLFVLNAAVQLETTFEVAAFLYDSGIIDDEPDMDEVACWSIKSADMSKGEYGYQPVIRRLAIVHGTFRNAVAHAITLPLVRYKGRLGTIKKIDIPEV